MFLIGDCTCEVRQISTLGAKWKERDEQQGVQKKKYGFLKGFSRVCYSELVVRKVPCIFKSLERGENYPNS